MHAERRNFLGYREGDFLSHSLTEIDSFLSPIIDRAYRFSAEKSVLSFYEFLNTQLHFRILEETHQLILDEVNNGNTKAIEILLFLNIKTIMTKATYFFTSNEEENGELVQDVCVQLYEQIPSIMKNISSGALVTYYLGSAAYKACVRHVANRENVIQEVVKDGLNSRLLTEIDALCVRHAKEFTMQEVFRFSASLFAKYGEEAKVSEVSIRHTLQMRSAERHLRPSVSEENRDPKESNQDEAELRIEMISILLSAGNQSTNRKVRGQMNEILGNFFKLSPENVQQDIYDLSTEELWEKYPELLSIIQLPPYTRRLKHFRYRVLDRFPKHSVKNSLSKLSTE
jgi:hypothetical protein